MENLNRQNESTLLRVDIPMAVIMLRKHYLILKPCTLTAFRRYRFHDLDHHPTGLMTTFLQ